MANRKIADGALTPITGATEFEISVGGSAQLKGTGTGIADFVQAWGVARTSTTGIGLTHTIGASAPSGVQSINTILANSQTNALIAHHINLGTSALAHTGLRIDSAGVNSSQVGTFVNMGIGTGTGVKISGAAGFTGINVTGQADSSTVGYKYTTTGNDPRGTAFKIDAVSTGRLSSFKAFDATLTSPSTSTPRTEDVFSLINTRNFGSASGITDNFDLMTLKRAVSATGASIVSNGAVLKIENQSSPPVLDNVDALEIVQDTDSDTGYPIRITQNGVVSSNFRRMMTETNTTVTQWISNGTTPNANLTGTTGDVCFNGPGGEIFHCVSGTVWQSTIDAPTAVVNSSNPSDTYYFAGLVIDTPGKTAFTISQAPVSDQALQLYLNGIQIPHSEWSLTGTALTYSGIALIVPPADGQPDELTVVMNVVSNGQPTKSYLTPAEYNANYGNRRVRNIGATGAQRMNFSVPLDFTGNIKVKARFYPVSGAGGTGKDIDLVGEYTNIAGASNTQYAFSDTTSTYNTGTDDTRTELDITSLFPNIAPGTEGAIFWDNNGIGGGLNFIDIESSST